MIAEAVITIIKIVLLLLLLLPCEARRLRRLGRYERRLERGLLLLAQPREFLLRMECTLLQPLLLALELLLALTQRRALILELLLRRLACLARRLLRRRGYGRSHCFLARPFGILGVRRLLVAKRGDGRATHRVGRQALRCCTRDPAAPSALCRLAAVRGLLRFWLLLLHLLLLHRLVVLVGHVLVLVGHLIESFDLARARLLSRALAIRWCARDLGLATEGCE